MARIDLDLAHSYRPLPASEIATGTMRSTVNANSANTTSRQPRSARPGTSMTAPNVNQTRRERSVPPSSVKRRSISWSRWSTAPKAMPATKAAMKPLVPATTETE